MRLSNTVGDHDKPATRWLSFASAQPLTRQNLLFSSSATQGTHLDLRFKMRCWTDCVVCAASDGLTRVSCQRLDAMHLVAATCHGHPGSVVGLEPTRTVSPELQANLNPTAFGAAASAFRQTLHSATSLWPTFLAWIRFPPISGPSISTALSALRLLFWPIRHRPIVHVPNQL